MARTLLLRAHVEASRMDNPIVRVSQMARRTARANLTANPIVLDSQMGQRIVRVNRTLLTIAGQLHVPDSRMRSQTDGQIIDPTTVLARNRMGQTTAERPHVLDSRRIVPDSQTTTHARALPKIAMCRALVARITPALTMAAQTTMVPPVPVTMLGPALLTIGLLLRKIATLPGTTPVPAHPRTVTFRRPTITTFPARHLRLLRSSSRANTLAHGRRTIARKNSHKRDPKIIVRRKRRR